jgi:quercetin dioxygenase-like cupin family protein
MTYIIDLGRVGSSNDDKDLSVTKLADDDNCAVIAISLKNGGVLAKHRAAEPITVLCFSGKAEFRAGPELRESAELTQGSLISLEAGIEHSVTALPEAIIIVTKFKNSNIRPGVPDARS